MYVFSQVTGCIGLMLCCSLFCSCLPLFSFKTVAWLISLVLLLGTTHVKCRSSEWVLPAEPTCLGMLPLMATKVRLSCLILLKFNLMLHSCACLLSSSHGIWVCTGRCLSLMLPTGHYDYGQHVSPILGMHFYVVIYLPAHVRPCTAWNGL